MTPRFGLPADALPPATALHQLECGAFCNEGAPLIVCVPAAEPWEPPKHALLALGRVQGRVAARIKQSGMDKLV